MVKYLLFFLLALSSLHATQMETNSSIILEDVAEQEDPLISKIKSFLDEATYANNVDFIKVIFDPKSSFYENDRVDSVKVIQTLKENGLLKLFFTHPRELQLNFKTSGAPLFFVKIMGDTLRNIGYYRYVTTASNLDASEFTWNIAMKSEYATDPLILDTQLQKSGCKIIDIERNSATEWTYVIDMQNGFLNVEELHDEEKLQLKRSLYAQWLNVSQVKHLKIKSSRRNSWYPYIAFYDASLHLLRVIKNDHISHTVSLSIPQNAKYIKISDIYTLKNVRDSLLLIPSDAK